MFENRREIMQDVFLTYLPAQHFKTSRLTLNLIAPLRRETASANALLPAVMRRGTVRYPDMESLSAALDTLYGANIDYTVRKKGERQCVGFAAGFIDDAFTPHGEKLLEPVA
ncbi:MAG TPA: insulinase family protein, partial [Oscillibacter sp.]|nr:insulinase family protein [Oscillibacter sp.]